MVEPTDAQLSAFLDESLPPEQLSAIEQRLRGDEELRKRLLVIIGREDAGLHSIGVIWRRHRLSCPNRDELSQYILQIIEPEHAAYIDFHLKVVGCRFCAANLDDLLQAQEAASKADGEMVQRRKRYFETSAGHLRQGN